MPQTYVQTGMALAGQRGEPPADPAGLLVEHGEREDGSLELRVGASVRARVVTSVVMVASPLSGAAAARAGRPSVSRPVNGNLGAGQGRSQLSPPSDALSCRPHRSSRGRPLTFLAARWYAASPDAPDRPSEEVARAVGEAVRPHPASRSFVARRLDRTAATGLLLTTALALTFVGVPPARSARAARSPRRAIQHVDNSVAAWGYDHRSARSTQRTAWGHGPRQHPDRRRACRPARRRRLPSPPQPVVVPLPPGRARRDGGLDARRQGSRRTASADAQPGSRDARALVPERPLGDRRRVLRRGGTDHRPSPAAAAGASSRSRSPSGSRSPSPGAACCSTSTGSQTSSAVSRSAGRWFALCAVIFGGRLLRPTAAAEVAADEAADGPAAPSPAREPAGVRGR